jgi:hypothetical protein
MTGIGFPIRMAVAGKVEAVRRDDYKNKPGYGIPQGMVRLESYGDNLKKDDYQCHSRFKRAINFSNGHSMVALVERTIGPGPHHIVISGIDPQKVEHLAITADELLLDGRRYPFASSCRYDSRIDLNGAIDNERFDANLHCFEHCLRQSAVPKSLTFLLEPKRKPCWCSALERSITERFGEGSRMVFSPDFLPGIKMLKGLGFGLTPSGDDFIGGILLALYYGQKIFKRNFERTIRLVHRTARGKNPFSNTMLADASEGRAVGRIKSLLAALIGGTEKNVHQSTMQLRVIGHSSGIDFGIGLLLTFKELIRNKGEQWW